MAPIATAHATAYKGVLITVFSASLRPPPEDRDIGLDGQAQRWTPLDIVEGGIHIGMNILRSAPTAAAIREVMTRAGVDPVPLPR
jgi:hypothetical protein